MFDINEMADMMAFGATIAAVEWLYFATGMWALTRPQPGLLYPPRER